MPSQSGTVISLPKEFFGFEFRSIESLSDVAYLQSQRSGTHEASIEYESKFTLATIPVLLVEDRSHATKVLGRMEHLVIRMQHVREPVRGERWSNSTILAGLTPRGASFVRHRRRQSNSNCWNVGLNHCASFTGYWDRRREASSRTPDHALPVA